MKKLIYILLPYVIILISLYIILILVFKYNVTFDSLLPNIIIGIFQIVVLGLFFHSITLIYQFKKKNKLYKCIKVILIEPFVRFKKPDINSINLDDINCQKTVKYFIKNVSKAPLNNYKEFLNVFFMQKISIVGLFSIASQINHVHLWSINALIASYTKAMDELELILKNSGFGTINKINNVSIFKGNFDHYIKIYSKNCLRYMKMKRL